MYACTNTHKEKEGEGGTQIRNGGREIDKERDWDTERERECEVFILFFILDMLGYKISFHLLKQ